MAGTFVRKRICNFIEISVELPSLKSVAVDKRQVTVVETKFPLGSFIRALLPFPCCVLLKISPKISANSS